MRHLMFALALVPTVAHAEDAAPAFTLDLKAPPPTIAVELNATELAAIENMCGVLQIQGVDGMRTVVGIDDKMIAADKALKARTPSDDHNRSKP